MRSQSVVQRSYVGSGWVNGQWRSHELATGRSPPLPFSFLFLLPFPFPSASLPLEVSPLKYSLGSGKPCMLPQPGLGGAPAEIEFGAF